MTLLSIIAVLAAAFLAQSPSPERAKPSSALQVRRFVAPAYPRKAHQKRIQGSAVAQLTLGTDGSVSSVVVSKGHPLFEKSVMAALRQWRFEPVPRVTVIEVRISFVFAEKCDDPTLDAADMGETYSEASLPDSVQVVTDLHCLRVKMH